MMTDKGIRQGACYFLIHALVEVVCFTILSEYYVRSGGILWAVALLFDTVAFVPQGIIGALNRRFKTLDIGSIGCLLMLAGVLTIRGGLDAMSIVGLLLLAAGNAFLHEAGAVSTTVFSSGRLFPGALFVAGGSFGVVTGQVLGGTAKLNTLWLILPLAVTELLVLASNRGWLSWEVRYPPFRLVRDPDKWTAVCLAALCVTACRSFIGYAIPISWRKELWQSFLLFGLMGLGKAMGGYLSDRFGARRIGLLSTLLCIPFLILGRDLMVVSILGVFCFSLTMSITFGMLLSIIPDAPGVAFGVTTLGLFLGMLPVFLFGSFGFWVNAALIVCLSLGSAYLLHKTLK